MRVIAMRISLLACALTAIGAATGAAPLLWMAAAWAVLGLAAFVAALAGVAP